MNNKKQYTTMKVQRPSRRWLKIEAAKRGITIGQMLELLIKEAEEAERQKEQ